jgi:hypothetical protein
LGYFARNETPRSFFFEILEEVWGGAQVNIGELKKSLKFIGANIVTEIKAKTKFDKNLWIERATSKVNESIEEVTKGMKFRITAMENAHKSIIQALEKKSGQDSMAMFKLGANFMKDGDWSYNPDSGNIEYKHTIVPKKIVRQHQEFDIPKDLKFLNSTFKVEGLYLQLQSNPQQAFCKAKKTRRNNKDVYEIVSGSVHVNVSEFQVCIGDLSGKPIYQIMQELPIMLEKMYLDSAFDSVLRDFLKQKVVDKTSGKDRKNLPVWDSQGIEPEEEDIFEGNRQVEAQRPETALNVADVPAVDVPVRPEDII